MSVYSQTVTLPFSRRKITIDHVDCENIILQTLSEMQHSMIHGTYLIYEASCYKKYPAPSRVYNWQDLMTEDKFIFSSCMILANAWL